MKNTMIDSEGNDTKLGSHVRFVVIAFGCAAIGFDAGWGIGLGVFLLLVAEPWAGKWHKED